MILKKKKGTTTKCKRFFIDSKTSYFKNLILIQELEASYSLLILKQALRFLYLIPGQKENNTENTEFLLTRNLI